MKQAFFVLNIALALGLFMAPVRGATISWASASSGNWSNPANWNPNQVPGPSDVAVITVDGNYTVTLDTNTFVGGLVLGAGDTNTEQTFQLNGNFFSLSGPATVSTNGVISLDGGGLSFDGTGDTFIYGTLTCSTGSLYGTLTIESNGVVNLIGTAGSNQPIDLYYLTLTNCGTVVWSNLDLNCYNGYYGLQIENYGLWDVQSDNTFYGSIGGDGISTFNNYGIVRKDGGSASATFDSSTAFNNLGTVDTETGQLNIDIGNDGGLFHTASNAIVQLDFNLSGEATFTGPGLVSGYLYGFNGVIGGTLNFYSGSLGGELTVASNAVLNLVEAAGATQPIGLYYLTLTNCGTVVWSNLDLDCSGNAQIENDGLWDAQSDNTFSGGVFDNYGIVRKDGGGASTTFDSSTAFNNLGTVDTETGQLNIDIGNDGGLFHTASNAIVQLDFNLSDEATFTGPGLVSGYLYGFTGGAIGGSLNFYSGSLGGTLTVVSNAVLNLVEAAGATQPVGLYYLTLTNCGTVVWSNLDLDCSGNAQIENDGLWDVQSDNTFSGGVFDNYGIVRKDGGGASTTFDGSTAFNNLGKMDVQNGSVSLEGNYSLTAGTLNLGINSPSHFGSLDLPNYASLSGRLSANFKNHYSPAVGNSFPVVEYNLETGAFTRLCLPQLPSGLSWQTNYTSTAFTLSIIASSPLQLSAGLNAGSGSISLSWNGLYGQTYQVQCTTNLEANWVNLGDPIAGTNGPITVLDDVVRANPQKFYRIELQ